MSSVRSDNNLYTNPKPAQEYERKQVTATEYVDWDSTDEVDDFFATAPRIPEWKNNKYFWVNGVYKEYTGTDWRNVAGNAADGDNGNILQDSKIGWGGPLIRSTYIDRQDNSFSIANTPDQIGAGLFLGANVAGLQFIKNAIDFTGTAIYLADEYINIVLPDSTNYTVGIYQGAIHFTTPILGVSQDYASFSKTNVYFRAYPNPGGKVLSTDSDGNLILIDAAAVNSLQSLSFVIGDDPGPPYDGFDGYLPAGNTAIIPQLIGKTLVSMNWGGGTQQSWNPGNQQFLFDPGNGEVDNSSQGGFFEGDWVIFNYK